MNVCFYASNAGDFSQFRGGVNRILTILSIELKKKGINIFFITNKGAVSDKEVDSDKEVFYLPDNKQDSEKNIQVLNKFIDDNKIDIFVNNNAIETEPLGLIKGLRGVKIISVHHNCLQCLLDHYTFTFKTYRNKYLTRFVDSFNLWFIIKKLFLIKSKRHWKQVIAHSDRFVLYFDSFIEEMNNLHGIKSNKISAIPNPSTYPPIEVDKLGITKRIIYVGRIVENQKRVDKLLKLWKRMHEEFKDWNFDLVGFGPLLDEAKNYVKEHNLDRITIHGFQNPQVFWEKADIFTMTSDFEGFGMVLIEAQALGTVPVSFNCFSAINEVVENGKTGFIVEGYDLNLMHEKVEELVSNQDLLMEMKKAGVQYSNKFNKETITRKWIELFNDVINNSSYAQ